jgi:hypothetical protein
VAVNANLNLFQTNTELLGWATGSFLVLTLFLLSGYLRRTDWQMLAVIVTVIGLHSLYWFSGGPDFGARYWWLILFPCIALTARGIEHLEGLAERAQRGAGRRVLAGTALLIGATVLLFGPWRAADKYYHYRGMRPEARRLAARLHLGNAIVLVRGNRFPDYATAAAYKPIDSAAAQTRFAWDRGAGVRRQLVRAFPGRPFWILDGPTLTRDGYRMIAGPLTGAELLVRADSLAPAQ